MKSTGNTILITGGGSGIGRGLAEAFHKLGNKVVIAGRRKEVLEATATANPGMEWMTLDIESADAIKTFAKEAAERFPALNVVINNAGIMKPEDWTAEAVDLGVAESIVTTNILGPIRLTAALLPQLKKQTEATVVMVSSGLAFLPLTMTPMYSASKAAIHSLSVSLRHQLRNTSVRVKELIPPYVQTELMGEGQKSDPRAMPLQEFLDEVMEIIKTQPDAEEINVKRVEPLRFSASNGMYETLFKALNETAH